MSETSHPRTEHEIKAAVESYIAAWVTLQTAEKVLGEAQRSLAEADKTLAQAAWSIDGVVVLYDPGLAVSITSEPEGSGQDCDIIQMSTAREILQARASWKEAQA